jgi:hypothetical protein
MRLRQLFRFRSVFNSGRSSAGPSIKISGGQGVLLGDNSQQTNNWYSIVVNFTERVRTYITRPDPPQGEAWLVTDAPDGHDSPAIEVSRRIVLWGAPGTGKTAYLAALGPALSSAVPRWTLRCSNEESTYTMIRLQQELLSQGRFPAPTEEPRWLEIEIARPAHGGRSSHSRTPEQPAVRIRLSILDPPGRGFTPDSAYAEGHIIDELAAADGIMFFFDPVREHELSDSYEYFFAMIAKLMHVRGERSPGSAEPRLPHRIAVCSTKLDERRVYSTASTLGCLTQDHSGMPTVAADRSEEFFETLCRTTGGTAMYLRNAIQTNFQERRTQYFAISSAGFYLDDSLNFNADDPMNVIEVATGDVRLRRKYIVPVNLLAPLIWLSASDERSAPRRPRPQHAPPALPAAQHYALPTTHHAALPAAPEPG